MFSVWDLTQEGHDPPLRDLGPLLMSELPLETAVGVEPAPTAGVKPPGLSRGEGPKGSLVFGDREKCVFLQRLAFIF